MAKSNKARSAQKQTPVNSDNKLIFIHIPKTGGTTVNAAMQQSFWQTDPDFNYRHIVKGTKKSNAGDIFRSGNLKKYQGYKIFMMFRDPVDRVTSEYHFIRERKEFLKTIKGRPSTFEEYIRSEQTQNGVVNFLKGRFFHGKKKATEADLADVLNAIEQLPIHIGILEQFEKSLGYFGEQFNITWKERIEAKRITFKRPKATELTDGLRDLIRECNPLDQKLYEFGVKRFEEATKNTKPAKVIFDKDKYAHVMPYCAKRCFFEFCLENKKFLKAHYVFFRALTFYILREKDIIDGRKFTHIWNQTFVDALSKQMPDSELAKNVAQAYNEQGDGLEQLDNIAQAVDHTLEVADRPEYYTPLHFNRQ